MCRAKTDRGLKVRHVVYHLLSGGAAYIKVSILVALQMDNLLQDLFVYTCMVHIFAACTLFLILSPSLISFAVDINSKF